MKNNKIKKIPLTCNNLTNSAYFFVQQGRQVFTVINFNRSFDSSFSLGLKYANGSDVEKSPTPAESSQENIEITKGPSPSNQSVASAAQEEDYPDQPQSPPHAPKN